MSLYFDYASATPVDPRVLEAMMPYFDVCYANASSLYQMGRAAREAVENARSQVAVSIGAKAHEIVFTSGGTEANNLAIFGTARARKLYAKRLVTSQIEHQAILKPMSWLESQGWSVNYLPVNSSGLIEVDTIDWQSEKTALCSLMLANNEIGTVQPLVDIFKQARKNGAYTHTDACQALGYIPIRVNELQADLLSLNSGKIYGPKGCGVLYIKEGIEIDPLFYGGKQEMSRRAGTENVAAIVGFGLACELATNALEEEVVRLRSLQQIMFKQLEVVPGCFINGDVDQRLPGNINVSFEDIEAEALMIYLDKAGIMVSSGSACSQAMTASHVLLAIGRNEALAQRSLRISLGRMTNEEDVLFLLATLEKLVVKLRA